MIELRGNIWDLAQEGDVICITTNGFVKSDGACVMGRGIALEAKKRFPHIEYDLGGLIREYGNIPMWIYTFPGIISFPVKSCNVSVNRNCSNIVSHMRYKFHEGDIAPGWASVANIGLIEESARRLELITRHITSNIYLPRPGCGAGELSWDIVKPKIEHILTSERFKVCTF